MRVRLLTAIIGEPWNPNGTLVRPDAVGRSWIERGLAVEVPDEVPEIAAAAPAPVLEEAPVIPPPVVAPVVADHPHPQKHGKASKPHRKMGAFLLSLFALLSTPALAVEMFTSAGTTVTATSACPTTLDVGQTCSSGWFSIDSLDRINLAIWNAGDAGTSTIVVDGRACDECNAYTLVTITDAASTQVPYTITPGAGSIRVRVTAIDGVEAVNIRAVLRASRPNGPRVW